MDIVDLHVRACAEFAERVQAIRDEQWHSPTPCAQWDVRTLVNHLAGEDRWTVPLFDGQTIAQVGDRFSGDLLGDDPIRLCLQAIEEATATVGRPGALHRTVHLSFGETPAEEYVWQLFADHLIHAWDLARAIGADERLDPELVEACATWFAEREDLYRSAGVIGPRPPTADDADPQTALLAAFGREASWSPSAPPAHPHSAAPKSAAAEP
jgi:uncharacterized protein (TIGR03086 family)